MTTSALQRAMDETEEANRQYAVFATTPQHAVFRVSDPLHFGTAQYEWAKLDQQRRDGLMPHVKHFEVRSVTLGPDRALVGPEVRSHDHYDRAPLSMLHRNRCVKGRGFGSVESASRKAWSLFTGDRFHVRPRYRGDASGDAAGEQSGVQGRGGWFYYPNGVTAAQGLDHLARVCKQRGMVVEGANGRWYVVDLNEPGV